MFKTFLLCAAALCALRFATAHGQAIEQAETKDIHEQITVECKEHVNYKLNMDHAKSVGKYAFSCLKLHKYTVIGLSVEGSEATKKLSGLGGSRAWCTYDGVVDNKSFTCFDQREPRSMLKVPKESCTVWEQDDNFPWFSTFVLDKKNVACSVSGMYGDLMYSFKAEKPSNKPEEPKSVTLHVTVFAAKGFLPPDPKPLLSQSERASANENEKQGEPAGKKTTAVEASRGHASAAAALSLALLVRPFAS
ncbi:hypothetical protein ERJ75_000874000 [Trypanosoma vivax]|nr:hypothetical protein ERJ75_000874000 [Trypanosoma vivax]